MTTSWPGFVPANPPPGLRAQIAGTSPAMTIKRSVALHPIFAAPQALLAIDRSALYSIPP
jgi:hypothetical protein